MVRASAIPDRSVFSFVVRCVWCRFVVDFVDVIVLCVIWCVAAFYIIKVKVQVRQHFNSLATLLLLLLCHCHQMPICVCYYGYIEQ